MFSLNTHCATSTRLGRTKGSASGSRSRENASEPGSPARSRRSPCSVGCTMTIAPPHDGGGRRKEPLQPTNCEVYSALAALGGHLRSNGEPGWIVLGRAYEKLLVL